MNIRRIEEAILMAIKIESQLPFSEQGYKGLELSIFKLNYWYIVVEIYLY